ncbi:cellulase family glycosylhydrolase [Candidatus Roizmanbacteria bacterium]|nr:cellulase family glycosylhydrolase [Candidatus Roizmanbacteria bacterium]
MHKFILVIFILMATALSVVIYYFREDLIANTKDWQNIRPQQYYGATVDMSQVLPESKNYIINSNGEDLIDIASKLGMNTLRIANITSITDQGLTASYTKKQWEEVLNKMRKKGMYAVILIEANSQDTKFNRVTLDDYYLNFVKNYIVNSIVCSSSNILAINIANEPLLNKDNLNKMKEASQMIKSACPKAMITIGSWRTDSGAKGPDGNPEYNWHDPKEVRQINDIVDMHSVHIYGFDKPKDGPFPDPYALTTGYLKEIRKYTNKPIFIEEFGAGNGDSLTDQNTLGSQDLQKKAYEGVLKAMYDFKNRGVLGATAYLLYPRTDGPESWNIAKDKGNTLLPAAYTFQKYSKNN